MLDSVKNVPLEQNGQANLDFNTIHSMLLKKNIVSQSINESKLDNVVTLNENKKFVSAV